MSLRIVPSSAHPNSTTNLSARHPNSTSTQGAPSAPGIHDTLRANLSSASTATPGSTVSAHPLEARLAGWQTTQDNLKMASLRRTFGIAEPVRRGMELNITRAGEWRPQMLGGSAGVSGDVLAGRDLEITWEDVYRGMWFSRLDHG
ncbi:hypothetical protein MMC29_001542 [Sticta canariensis]|nr:hypothetical protein [Sticta canariensis]